MKRELNLSKCYTDTWWIYCSGIWQPVK